VPDMEHLARSVFSEGEIIDLLDLPARFRLDAFFAAWTRKEAYIKAIGTGMNCPLDSFQVTLRPGEEARIVKIGRNSDAADQWSMHTFDPEAGYSAALAYPGPKREIQWMPVREAAELIWAV
jgi:4'-phosphopantetheinyl transferase